MYNFWRDIVKHKMPYRRKRRFTRRFKRRSNPYTRYSGFHTARPSWVQNNLVPAQRVVRMRWEVSADTEEVNNILVTTNSFRANDCFQPQAAGHSAFGFNQYASFYEDWMVIGSKARVIIERANLDALPALLPVDFGLIWSPSVTGFAPYSNAQQFIESQLGQWKTWLPSETTNTCIKLTSKYSAKKTYGTDWLVGAGLRGTFNGGGGSPSLLNHFIIWYQPYKATNTPIPPEYTIPRGAFSYRLVTDFLVLVSTPRAQFTS